MEPIGSAYPIGGKRAEFRRKPMTTRVKQAISRGLKKRRQMKAFKKYKTARYVGAGLLGLYAANQARELVRDYG